MSNLIGEIIDHYKIQSKLGEGGMAVVYKAIDTRLKRNVALKLIRIDKFPPASLDQILERFDREATILASMQHSNIVTVYEYGQHKHVPYLVMEYLSGGTLRQRMGQPMSYASAAAILHPVANALVYAHGEGIVHRDVKPSNIIYSKSGIPKLSDFGIVRILGIEEKVKQLTETGMGVGTPDYMAPEQWYGQISTAVDIYPLGIIFYEMLTGRLPYDANTPAEHLVKKATQPIPDLRTIIPDLPDTVVTILHRALAQKPEDRFPTMSSFSNALNELANECVDSGETLYLTPTTTENKQTHIAPVTNTPTQTSWRLPISIIAGFGGLFVLMMLCGLGCFWLWSNSKAMGMSLHTATLTAESVVAMSATSFSPTFTKTPQPTAFHTFTSTLPRPGATIAYSTSTIQVHEVAINLTGNVYCRSGPSKAYTVVTSFEKGLQLTVQGKNDNSSWFLVLIPDEDMGYCWLTAQHSTIIEGDSAYLPTVIPPSSPTPRPVPESKESGDSSNEMPSPTLPTP